MIRPMEINSEEEWLVAQRAVEVQREVSRAAGAAEPGRGLMETEAMVHEQGEKFLRMVLENAIRQQVGTKKKTKGDSSVSCACGGRASYRRCIPKYLLSSVGTITVERRYYGCRHCGQKQVPWDVWAGVDYRQITPYARKLVVLVASMCSFDRSAEKLKQLCRMQINNDTIRRIADEEGQRVQSWLANAAEAVTPLQAGKGEWEFYTDGTTVNTVAGWRDLRLTILCRREAGAPASPEEWKDRVLPQATARWAFGQVVDAETLGVFWDRLMQRVKKEDGSHLSVLADGAKYIWQQMALHIGSQAEWVLDIFHVSEHVHDCARGIWGEGSTATDWADEQLHYVLRHGGASWVKHLRAGRDRLSAGQRVPLDQLLGYLEPHQDDLWYRERLQRGLVIGSGTVEGACKNMVGARLKINSCRWRVERAEHMTALRSLDYAGLVETYWTQRAA